MAVIYAGRMDEQTPTLASMMPARVRAWMYAILAALYPTTLFAVEVYDVNDDVANGVAVASVFFVSGGFILANRNTPTS